MLEPMYYNNYSYSNFNNSSKNNNKNKDDLLKNIVSNSNPNNTFTSEIVNELFSNVDNKKEIKIEIEKATWEEEVKEEENITEIKLNSKDKKEYNNIIKQFILNPLTVIIKLAILSCKQIGTKIHIQNNIVYFQEPGIFQSLTRYIFNSNKSHLQYLYNPITIACKKYLSKDFVSFNPNITNLFVFAKNGIESLIKTYNSCPITVLCLKYYHVILTNYIKKTYNEYIFKENPLQQDITDCFYTMDFLNKMEEQWSSSKLKIILDLIEFLFNSDNNENKSNNIKSLETIVLTIDEETQKIMLSM